MNDELLKLMSGIYGTERAVLVSLAATIASGIEASNPEWHTSPELVAKRAIEVAKAIVVEVTR